MATEKLTAAEIKQLVIDIISKDESLKAIDDDGDPCVMLHSRDIDHVAARVSMHVAVYHEGKTIADF